MVIICQKKYDLETPPKAGQFKVYQIQKTFCFILVASSMMIVLLKGMNMETNALQTAVKKYHFYELNSFKGWTSDKCLLKKIIMQYVRYCKWHENNWILTGDYTSQWLYSAQKKKVNSLGSANYSFPIVMKWAQKDFTPLNREKIFRTFRAVNFLFLTTV